MSGILVVSPPSPTWPTGIGAGRPIWSESLVRNHLPTISFHN